MHMYVVFITLLQNYEKAVHAHNYRFFWKGLCFISISTVLFQLHGSKAGLFEDNVFWVGQYDSPNLHRPLFCLPLIGKRCAGNEVGKLK